MNEEEKQKIRDLISYNKFLRKIHKSRVIKSEAIIVTLLALSILSGATLVIFVILGISIGLFYKIIKNSKKATKIRKIIDDLYKKIVETEYIQPQRPWQHEDSLIEITQR